jgi:RsiW-degrading membrane proteinase PrsW (M82 family)
MTSPVRAFEDLLKRPDWGTVRFGQTQAPLRLVITAGGATVWLVTLLVGTGSHAIDAITTNLLLVAGLLALASFSRSVSVRELVSLVFAGGAMLLVAWVVVEVFEASGVKSGQPERPFVVAMLEEPIKLLPVAFILWSGRRSRTWSMGATDILLMCAASGAGFALFEDSFIREKAGWGGSISWLPPAEDLGAHGVIAGHAIWSALAGATLGMALLLRNKERRLAIGLALCGIGWAIFDHFGNNYSNIRHDSLNDLLRGVSADGHVTIWLFVIAVIGAIAADLHVLHRSGLPQPPEVAPIKAGAGTLLKAWAYTLDRRALAFAAHQLRYAPPLEREEVGDVIRNLVNSLVDRRFASEAQQPLPA